MALARSQLDGWRPGFSLVKLHSQEAKRAMREVVSDTFSSLVSVAKQLQEGTRHSSAVFESAVDSQVWQLGSIKKRK